MAQLRDGLTEWLMRARDWFRRDALDGELAEELDFHRRQLERELSASGMSATDAVHAARRRLGSTINARADARERWSIPWLDWLQQDVRLALRDLRRAPGFAAAVVATLALGIGANAAMFAVLDRLMLRPAPYLRDAARVDRVYLRTAGWNADRPYAVFPYTRYLDLTRWTTSFDGAAAFTAASHGVGTGDAAREHEVLGVSGSFFALFDARPAMGRFFGPAEDALPRGADVAVVSWAYWLSELGARDVVGERLQVGSGTYTIVGVAPRGFVGVAEESPPAVIVPITAYAANEGNVPAPDYYTKYQWDWAQAIVRRHPGVTRAEAAADLTRAFYRSWDAALTVHPLIGPAAPRGLRAVAGPVKRAAGPDPGLASRTLVWVAGVALMVLLIACANVANLLLARALRRRREVALRVALGASRARLAVQALTESLVLALLGAGAGLLVAHWVGTGLQRLFLGEAEPLAVAADPRTLVAALAAALSSALLTAIAPVWLARGGHPIATLRAGARGLGYRRSRVRDALLVTQGALTVVLLVGAGLFARSLGHARTLRLGYDVDPLLVARWERRGTPLDSAAEARVRGALVAAALARPEVSHAAWVTNPVFGRGTSTLLLSVPGVDSVDRLGRFTFQTVSADYFATVGTRIVRGRAFTAADRAGAPAAVVVSEAMARKLWPGRDPLGRCLRYSWRDEPVLSPCATVVGVAEDAVHDPVADFPMRYYLPDDQLDFGANTLLLRTRTDRAAAVDGLRRALQAALPGHALVSVREARELRDAKQRSWVIGASLFSALAVLALAVAALGVYGVVSYDVEQRAHEIGVRVALGAGAAALVRMVVGQGVRVMAVGVAAGIALALVASRWIQPLLFRQSALDARVYGAVAAALLVVAVAATLRPAARAVRADPNVVLRAD